ncbi:helix-turn-helix domain-containing protein [Paeniglutamicibacter sp. R2-26]|uniref:helix-turn-helix domain-containing protein n=1 Tax=Paeniglutamicibacter sp. R2-26 TaxID=3144417 RepID=UPI003EE72DF9
MKLQQAEGFFDACVPENPTRDDLDQLVSDINFSNYERLLRRLYHARLSAGRTVEQVAELIGCDKDLIESIESGEYELSAGELREFALAVNSIVEYNVVDIAAERIAEKFIHRFTREAANEQWVAVRHYDWQTSKAVLALASTRGSITVTP